MTGADFRPDLIHGRIRRAAVDAASDGSAQPCQLLIAGSWFQRATSSGVITAFGCTSSIVLMLIVS
jgi:hypothetical protein